MLGSSPYGRRLLPQVLDFYNHNDPGRVYAYCGVFDNNELQFRGYTVRDIAIATNECAWRTKQHVNITECFEAVAFLGTADLRYPIFCLAGIKCGWITLLLGPRNSIAQNMSLLKRAKCSKIVYTKELKRTVQLLQELESGICAVELPSLESLLLSSNTAHFAYHKSFEEAENDPVICIHSSGSTGDPKIITLTNGTLATTDNDRNIPVPEGRNPQNAMQFCCKFFTSFPPYHLAGVQAYLTLPMFYSNATVVLGPPDIPPTGQLMVHILRQQEDVKAFYVPASIIEQWAATPEGLEQSKRLDFILYGGGTLSHQIGTQLSQYTSVRQMYGSAEVGQIQTLVSEDNEWSYLEWNPYEEVDMQPHSEGGFEVVLHQDYKFRRSRSLSHNFPDAKVWRMGDLFTPHPTKRNLWKYLSRADDIVVLSNGHKINPTAIESQIQTHPRVSAAIVLGDGRSQPVGLLELHSNTDSKQIEDAVEEIWPIIHSINLNLPEYARLSKSMIIVGNPAKPFPRTPKGTLSRKVVINLYTPEINALYEGQGSPAASISLVGSSLQEITDFVKSSMALLLEKNDIHEHDNFFHLGMDSIKVFEALRMIKSETRLVKTVENTTAYSPSLIYQSPTVKGLSKVLNGVLNGTGLGEPEKATIEKDMERLVDLYTKGLPQRPSVFPATVAPTPYTVLLTGSTGSLGSQFLNDVIENSVVSKIYCFIRADRPLSSTSKSKKVVNIIADFGQPRFGLVAETYNHLLSNVNVIIYLAWRVDFNLPLQAFEADCIRSVRSLVDFNMESELNPRIVFASSTSYALKRLISSPESTIVEEDILERPCIDTGNGYAQSKEVAEQILAFSSKNSGIPVSILRIGQISGHDSIEKSSWPSQEWLPALVRTSRSLGLIPDINLSVDWVPVNRVSQFIQDLTAATREADSMRQSSLLEVYNIVHPWPREWSSFVNALQRKHPKAKVVPLRQWVDALRAHGETSKDAINELPALKIITFFDGLVEGGPAFRRQPMIRVSKSMSLSKAFSEMPTISDTLLDKWAGQV